MARLRESYAEIGRELDLGDPDSPITLFASLEISLTDPNASGDVGAALARRPGTSSACSPSRPSTTRCSGIINVIRTVGLVGVGLVGLTVLFMIINTIRIAVYSRANEIEIMRLVGASDSFIRWPFILEGILCGLVGALVTIALVAAAWDPIQPAMVTVFQMPTAVSTRFLTTISVVLFSVGLGIGALGSWISVRSYLAAAR